MKRIFTGILVLFIVISLCNNVFAVDPKSRISRWILADGNKSFYVKPLVLPKILYEASTSGARGTLSLLDLSLEMNIEDAMPYADSFYKGIIIPTLTLYGVNTENQPVLKITISQNFVSSFTTGKMLTGRLKDPTKSAVSFRAVKISTQKVYGSGPAPIKLSSSAGKLDIGKIYLDNTLLTDTKGISEIKGETGYESHVASGAGSSLLTYSTAQFDVNYNSIGNLPDWLAAFDTQKNSIVNSNLSHKLKYELTSSNSSNKLTVNIDMNICGQEIFVDETGSVFCYYLFDVTKISSGSTSASTSATKQGYSASKWNGKWDTSFGPMTLVQTGSNVTGTAGEQDEFTLKGVSSLSKLAGTWSDGTNEGSFQFLMAADGKSFEGYMIDSSDGKEEKFEWNGEKV